MDIVWTKSGLYKRHLYASESELEAAINEVRSTLFGVNRHYLDVKKKIGAKGGLRNIPDGYLIDLSGKQPRLYVVENELERHEPLRHISVQILEFSLSFEQEPRAVKTILLAALQAQPEAKLSCEQYAATRGFRNLDHMLEHLVFEGPFAALVIIDQLPEKLETILAKKFKFGVEVLELTCYQNEKSDRFFLFEPFLQDLENDLPTELNAQSGEERRADPTEVDTVVITAREEGFQTVFIGENRWHHVRIHGTMRPQIKYAAAYQVAPVSAITHIAPVKSIEPWGETGKFVLNFSEPAIPIGPIQFVPSGRIKAPQSLRYTTKNRLEQAKTLDDVW
jgi:hypothetical protein